MKVLTQYALQFVGLPYRWGGNSPVLGMDCSGFIQELLASVGLDPRGDQTAQKLYYILKTDESQVQHSDERAGNLIFYGLSTDQITHVSFQLDANRVIESGGGGPLTLTARDADAHGAFIKIRHVRHRKDIIVAKLRPDYKSVGIK